MGGNAKGICGSVLSCDLLGQAAPDNIPKRRRSGILSGATRGVRQRYGFKIYAYVLMSNHVHLLIETGGVELSKIMQGLQLRYTGYQNRKYKKVGHVFQGEMEASGHEDELKKIN